jgi:hypothetical protein
MKKTIGFNNKKNMWTSKYDYESSNYASLDKQFFSCRKTVKSTDDVVCWEHNKNPVNNNFYGDQYSSAIAVSFNDNPSQNKIYKTFSVEGTENLKGSLHTFTTSETLQPGKQPRAITIGTLSDKGGILYGHMPRDTRIKPNVNMKFIGSISGQTLFSTIGGGLSNLYAFTNVFGNAASFGGRTKLIFAFGDSTNPEVILSSGASATISSNTDYYTLDSGFNLASASELENIDETILLEDGIVFSATAAALSSFQQKLSPSGRASIFAITDPQLNGDFLRGQYAESVINLGSDNFELYSLNLNYEPTDLDHSK